MERIWLASYPAGVPAEIDSSAVGSLKAMAESRFTELAPRAAFTQMGRTLSYGELGALSGAFGAWLRHVAGLEQGERIAIMLPNVLQYPIVLFGALRAGLTVVNANPLYTARELEHQLRDSGAKAIVVLENFTRVVAEALPATQVTHVLTTAVGDFLTFPKSWLVNAAVRFRGRAAPRPRIEGALDLADALRVGRTLELGPVELGTDDVAFLQYTGGTTGVAKAAVLTHGNVCANVLQARAWIGPYLAKSSDGAQDVIVTAIPLYHIFALTANCLVFLELGWRNLLITDPRDLTGFVRELARTPFGCLSGVNTLFNALLNTPGFARLNFSRLKIALGGGMAVQASVAERWATVTGHPICQAWGLTETSPGVCINPPDAVFNGSVGLPISSTEVSVKDDAGRDLPIGTRGELCVRGPQVMRGYWNRAEETAKVLMPDGWLRTGDIGHMDERGYVYLDDRKKDMIVVSGFNVYPNEVEEVAASHPGVLEAAAVAQPDERSGEVVALYVVRKDPHLTETDILDFCRKSLTRYKVPKHVYFRSDLPKSNVGKVLRRQLRAEHEPH